MTTVTGTQRHAFDTGRVRALLETAPPDELRRMLDEALHVVDGLRQDAVAMAASAARICNTHERSQWAGERNG